MNSGEDLYKSVFEESPIGLIVLKLDVKGDPSSLRQVASNEAASRITRKEKGVDDGKLWSEAYPELRGTPMGDRITDVVSTGRTAEWLIVNGEFRFDGAPISCRASRIDDHTVLIQLIGPGLQQLEMEEIQKRNTGLKEKITDQSHSLSSARKELESFAYSVSHDLRAPLRRLDGFSRELLDEYGDRLDETGRHYLDRIRNSAQKMGMLIDDLLKLSRISRNQIQKEHFELGPVAAEIMDELRASEPEREVDFSVDGRLGITADKGLIRVLLHNLLANAWKFTGNRESARIEIGSTERNGTTAYYVRDNGTGFDMKYAENLFRPFHRLHSEREFEGSGIGLATAQRIINRHGGTIWGESEPGGGATFYFTIGQDRGDKQ